MTVGAFLTSSNPKFIPRLLEPGEQRLQEAAGLGSSRQGCERQCLGNGDSDPELAGSAGADTLSITPGWASSQPFRPAGPRRPVLPVPRHFPRLSAADHTTHYHQINPDTQHLTL